MSGSVVYTNKFYWVFFVSSKICPGTKFREMPPPPLVTLRTAHLGFIVTHEERQKTSGGHPAGTPCTSNILLFHREGSEAVRDDLEV